MLHNLRTVQILALTLLQACLPSDVPGSTTDELVGDWESPVINYDNFMAATISGSSNHYSMVGTVVVSEPSNSMGMNQFVASIKHLQGTTYEVELQSQDVLVAYGDPEVQELDPVYLCDADFSHGDTLYCEGQTHEFGLWRPDY